MHVFNRPPSFCVCECGTEGAATSAAERFKMILSASVVFECAQSVCV